MKSLHKKIMEGLLTKYGHLSDSELRDALRNDGLGKFVDAIENDPIIMGLIDEISNELSSAGKIDREFGIIHQNVQPIQGIPVDYHGTIYFDPNACIRSCEGNCCKNKNYLMINIGDIYRIVSSKVAIFWGIKSTIDLFDHQPPFIEIFYNEEYRWYFPYIRFLPTGMDITIRPEEAEGSVCPFLRPIDEVYKLHNKFVPSWVGKEAMGCMLMKDKPDICRLSPLGKCQGMVTGKVTYEYLPPALDCPACDTEIEIKVSDYLYPIISYKKHKQQLQFHKMLMANYHNETSYILDQERFHMIVIQVYNIDDLLSQHGLGIEHRPPVEQLIEIVFAASSGDYSIYEKFVEGLQEKKENNGK